MKHIRERARAAQRARQRKQARMRLMHRRGYVIAQIGERIQWECKKGHQFWSDVEFAFEKKLAAHYWTKQGGGAGITCPHCLKEEYAAIDARLGI